MVNIGLIGTGYIGRCHAEGWAGVEGARISAVCDKRQEQATLFAKDLDAKVFTNLDEMLASEIDVLDVCLPTGLHYATVTAALEKKISVLCEKPMALELSEAEDMVKLSQKNDVLFMIAHCVRFDPKYAFLKKAIKDQLYGKLRSLRLFRDSAVPLYSESQWLLDASRSGGVTMDLHVHDVDLTYWLLGAPEWVFTRANNSSINTSYGYSDTVVSTEASWREHKAFPFNAGFDAQFETATLKCDAGTLTLSTETETTVLSEILDKLSSPAISSSGLYQNELAYFYYCFTNNQKPDYCSPIDSLTAHRLLMLEKRSAQTGEKLLFI